MTRNDKPDLFVVDGSNVATEGRSKPSLEQLNEAVAAFREQYPDVKVTVVVDATFGHRIAKKEVKAFDAAVANNELVTPPAGAVGRGDAFILAIADKAKAGVFSNDSFQEFHGDYEWLFEPGRLIGGKPVPHVGWVFVDRNPVRGPRSREAVRAAKRTVVAAGSPTDAKEQAQRRVRKKSAAVEAANVEPAVIESAVPEAASPDVVPLEAVPPRAGRHGSVVLANRGPHVNDPAAFFDFVERHPAGSTVRGQVDSYASHGAYAMVGAVKVYIPLRLMGDPAPTSARKVLKLGDDVDLKVAAFVPDRLSIDAALSSTAAVGGAVAAEPEPDATTPARRASRRRPVAKPAAVAQTSTKQAAPAKKRAGKQAAEKAPSKRLAEPAAETQTSRTPAVKKAAAKPAAKQAAKKAAAKQAAKKAAAKQAAKKPAAKAPAKAPAKKQAAGAPRRRAKQTATNGAASS